MSLLEGVAAVLKDRGISFALIGASAMAAYGVARSTIDQDLLVVDPSSLSRSLWESLQQDGVDVEIRKGDLLDPLAGVVRLERSGERPLDLVVGKYRWQREILERAHPGEIPLVRGADLILLKLYAGGPQDSWDIQQLLMSTHRENLISEVNDRLSDLGTECAARWQKILAG